MESIAYSALTARLERGVYTRAAARRIIQTLFDHDALTRPEYEDLLCRTEALPDADAQTGR